MTCTTNHDMLLKGLMLFCGLCLLIGCSTNEGIQTMTIKTLIDCWLASDPSYTWNPPATGAEIRAAEEKIGSPLPSPLRELYQIYNGDGIEGLFLYRLHPNPPDHSFGLTDVNEKFNEWGWHIPEEIRLFAHVGGGEHYGIWLPKSDSEIFKHPIIEVGSIFEPGCMAVVGTNLTSFLLGRSAYHFISEIYHFDSDEESNASNRLNQLQTALDILQVPQILRHVEFFGDDERHFSQIIKWADPLLPTRVPVLISRGIPSQT